MDPQDQPGSLGFLHCYIDSGAIRDASPGDLTVSGVLGGIAKDDIGKYTLDVDSSLEVPFGINLTVTENAHTFGTGPRFATASWDNDPVVPGGIKICVYDASGTLADPTGGLIVNILPT